MGREGMTKEILNNEKDLIERNPMEKIQLFESKKIRSHWDEENELWYFSVIDAIEVLTKSDRPRKYWSDLKSKLRKEGSKLSEEIGQLNMKAYR